MCCSVVALLCSGPKARSVAMKVEEKLAWVCPPVYSERIRANSIWLGSISSRDLVAVPTHCQCSVRSAVKQRTLNACEAEG